MLLHALSAQVIPNNDVVTALMLCHSVTCIMYRILWTAGKAIAKLVHLSLPLEISQQDHAAHGVPTQLSHEKWRDSQACLQVL